MDDGQEKLFGVAAELPPEIEMAVDEDVERAIVSTVSARFAVRFVGFFLYLFALHRFFHQDFDALSSGLSIVILALQFLVLVFALPLVYIFQALSLLIGFEGPWTTVSIEDVNAEDANSLIGVELLYHGANFLLGFVLLADLIQQLSS